MSRFLSLPLVILMAAIAGCGESFEKEVAPVTGKVFCGGETMTSGMVVFTPKVASGSNMMDAGKTATAFIQPDGTYVLTTYDDEDGAIIGEHEVRIYKPDPEDDESPEAMDYDMDPHLCGQNLIQVTVEDKDNVIDLDPARG